MLFICQVFQLKGYNVLYRPVELVVKEVFITSFIGVMTYLFLSFMCVLTVESRCHASQSFTCNYDSVILTFGHRRYLRN
jgi:hypothetical protein